MSNEVEKPNSRIEVGDVRARKDSIARITFGYWNDLPKQESMVQLTNPIGQHIAFYVHPDEKVRFIADLRKSLNDWEKCP